MAYREEEFIKELNGISAPKGFHYMPSGRLMNDADHIAVNGYVEKKITFIDIDIKDIHYSGESRVFKLNGNGYFSMELYDNAATPNYYNFYNHSWSTSKNGSIHKEKLVNSYSNYIAFEENTSSLKTYTLVITAETVYNCKTIHKPYVEFRNEDNSINQNKSTGSNSNLVIKSLYQDVEKKLYLSCIAPSKYATITDTVDGATSSSNRIIFDNKLSDKGAFEGDLVTTSEAAIGVFTLITSINPDGDNEKEVQTNVSNSLTDGVTVTLTPPFNGVTPHSSDSTTGRDELSISTGGSLESNFTITVTAPSGRLLTLLDNPSTEDLCFFKTVTIGSAGLPLPGEDVSSSTFFRFPVDNITGLMSGMQLDPARSGGGANTNTPSAISSYSKTETVQAIREGDIYNVVYNKSVQLETEIAVNPGVNEITAIDRNGIKTAQAGNIIFDKQQPDALKGDSSVRIFGHGKQMIKSLTGMDIEISDIETTSTKLFVTTSGSTSSSTTIPLASTDGGMGNVVAGAELSGINIDATVANPTVVSKAGQTGAGNIVVSSAQTLESGQTLEVKDLTTSIVITGKVKVSNFPLADTTIFFDLERFVASV